MLYRSWFLLIVPIILSAIVLAIPSTEVPEPKQVLRLNLFSDPNTLDPRLANDLTTGAPIRALYEGLTRLDPCGHPILAAAERMEELEPNRVFRFHLRRTRWSNGDPVTASDFVRAWSSLLAPDFPGECAYRLHCLKNGRAIKEQRLPVEQLGVKAESAHTLYIELEYPCPHFLELLACYSYYPIHPNMSPKEVVSNGPFRLLTWTHGNEIRMERNPFYWDSEHVYVDQISMVMVNDETTELRMFQNGELHWAGSPLSALPYDALEHLDKLNTIHCQQIMGSYDYKINTGRPPFDHPKMRQAFALAVDKETLTTHVLQGGGAPSGSPVPWADVSSRFDPEKARALFEEALAERGWTRETMPPVTLSYNTADSHHKLAQAIQQQWSRTFAIPIYLRNSEWKVHLSDMAKHNFQIGRKGWIADTRDPLEFLEPYTGLNSERGGGNNDTQWKDPNFVRAIEAARHSKTAKERAYHIEEAIQIWQEAAPVIPIFSHTFRYLQSPQVEGIYLTPLGNLDLTHARLK